MLHLKTHPSKTLIQKSSKPSSFWSFQPPEPFTSQLTELWGSSSPRAPHVAPHETGSWASLKLKSYSYEALEKEPKNKWHKPVSKTKTPAKTKKSNQNQRSKAPWIPSISFEPPRQVALQTVHWRVAQSRCDQSPALGDGIGRWLRG